MMPWLLNTAWMAACLPEARRFRQAMRRVASTQAELLGSILRANRNTAFGQRHNFAAIASPHDYQQRVPLSDYAAFAADIARIGTGGTNVLTHEKVDLLEPTSGTTGGEKLIPFTASLRTQFQRALAAWMFDLLAHRPALRRGRAYWSISPTFAAPRQTAGGIPIGFDDDAAYLGRATQWMVRHLLAVPNDVAKAPSLDAFRYQTLLHLLAAEDLTLISIWSPTFLLALFSPLEAWADRLCHDTALPTARRTAVQFILLSRHSLAEKLARLWPHLALISCWTDAGAARYVPALTALFPHVELQPKGLLATEGCVSFPLLAYAAPALALRSHFFEFQEAADPARVRLAHELDRGGRYRVVLTTAGGLCRYQLHDEIDIIDFADQCPLLRFVGKADGTSDLVGEKLAEPHVRAAIDALTRGHGLAPSFALLVPATDPPHYRLYLQDAALAPADLPALEKELEAALSQNPHYAYARRLTQLAPLQIIMLNPRGVSAHALYEQHCVALGQRPGNIKPVALDRRPGWPEVFAPASLPHTSSAPVPPATAAAQTP